MKGKNYVIAIALLATLVCISPAMAQMSQSMGQQRGTVSVDISNVKADIARSLNVDQNSLPSSVQAPMRVAANVCGMSSDSMSRQGGDTGTASCQAQTTSSDLNRIVQQQMRGSRSY